MSDLGLSFDPEDFPGLGGLLRETDTGIPYDRTNDGLLHLLDDVVVVDDEPPMTINVVEVDFTSGGS